MKIYRFLFLLFILLNSTYFAQSEDIIQLTGKVTFISSQNVYVLFDDMKGIQPQDTLWMKDRNSIKPAVIVKFVSSTSCAGIPLLSDKIKIDDSLFAFIHPVKQEKSNTELNTTAPAAANTLQAVVDDEKKKDATQSSVINGRFGISSYSSFTNASNQKAIQRWRYIFSLDAQNISGSPISVNSYVTFSYKTNDWGKVQNNLMNALKIYDLSLDYNFSEGTKLSVGRKINSKASNIGAVDGLQFETKLGSFYSGIVIGSRPNYNDYSYNFKMFEYGVYIGRADTIGNGIMQNNIAVFQQTNNFKTDRRFIYIQHSSNIIKNIRLFASSEIDIYKRKNGVEQSSFSLTNIFISANYSPNRFFSINTSYDARKNVIYYETFKSYADSLLESETRQGLRARINIRPVNYVMISFSYGYRFKTNDLNSTKNYSGSLSWSRIPIIDASTNISYNRLFTNYVDGSIIGLRIYKDIFSYNLNLGVGYRKVNYNYTHSNGNLTQNIFSVDVSWKLFAKVYLSVSYEGTFETRRNYSTLYLNLTTRF